MGVNSIPNRMIGAQQQWSLELDREGVNLAYRIAWKACFLGKKGLKSGYELAERAILTFRDLLFGLSDVPWCMSIKELNARRLLKRKHYHYAAYLAALSAVPILSKITEEEPLLDALMAKMCAIVSIKVLDNVNDAWHTDDDIVRSLNNQLAAFVGEPYEIYKSDSVVRRAENYTFQLAKSCWDRLSKYRRPEARFFEGYKEDLRKYIKGQTDSLLQKHSWVGKSRDLVDIERFLRDINEKGVGNIWVDVDFCVVEGLRELSMDEVEALELIGKAMDHVFKGCNVYDDVADLEADLKAGILNSVVYLALDRGVCSAADLLNPERAMQKIQAAGGMKQAIRLGDLIYLRGFRYLDLAGELANLLDLEALVYGLKILRLFAMRKWLVKQRNPLGAISMMRPVKQDSFRHYEAFF